MTMLMGLGVKKHIIPHEKNQFQKGFSLNTGNLLFNFASELIADLEPEIIPWGMNAKVINKKTDSVLLPMANHVGKHVDLSEKGPRIGEIDGTVVALGLGAQFELSGHSLDDIPKGTIDWIDTLISKSSVINIGVRGNYTKKVLTDLGFGDDIVVTGCPSLFINPSKNLGSDLYNKYLSTDKNKKLNKLAIAAGNPFKKDGSTIERYFIGLVNKYDANYIIQHPLALIALASGWEDEISDRNKSVIKDRWFPSISESAMKEWFERKTSVYVSVPQWIYDVSRADFCVGTRIHGAQASIQAGTPAVCVYIDSRTKELCEFMNIPHIGLHQVSNHEGDIMDLLFSVFEEWDWAAFDVNRINLANKMIDFLESNKINTTSHLKNLAY
mgnify:CR=1 FL=1